MVSTPEKRKKVRIVCISDTHNHGPGQGFTLPKGDILIHAGDLTKQGSQHELEKAVDWIGKADFAIKIVVAGKHDLSLDPTYAIHPDRGWKVAPDDTELCQRLLEGVPGLVYLQHTGRTIRIPDHSHSSSSAGVSFRVFGSPYSAAAPELDQNWAFQYPEAEADALWEAVPAETDILITHTPAQGYCDASHHWTSGGCPSLARALRRVRPLLHVCGHCHEGRGARVVSWRDNEGEEESVRTWEDPGAGSKKQSLFDLTGLKGGNEVEKGRETAIVNASIRAKVFNKPIVVDVLL